MNMKIRVKKNDAVYEIETLEDLMKITRDGEIIHVQFASITQQVLLDLGLQTWNDILLNIGDYIDFCESKQVYKSISFDSDEWETHTKIYATIRYVSPEDGEINAYQKQIDSVRGNMKGTRADKVIEEKYEPFAYGEEEIDADETNGKMSMEELVAYINKNQGNTLYHL